MEDKQRPLCFMMNAYNEADYEIQMARRARIIAHKAKLNASHTEMMKRQTTGINDHEVPSKDKILLPNFTKHKLSLLQDIVFKTVFSDQQVLIPFLNDVLLSRPDLAHLKLRKVTKLVLRNSELMCYPGVSLPRIRFDVLAHDAEGVVYNVEMQREFGSFKDLKRFQFYGCQNLVANFHELAQKYLTTEKTTKPSKTAKPPKTKPLKDDDSISTDEGSIDTLLEKIPKKDLADIYRMLPTVIVMVITDESIPAKAFRDKNQVTHCGTKTEYGELAAVNELFIDLSKVKRSWDQSTTDADKWFHFLRYTDGRHEIDDQTLDGYCQNPGMRIALKKLENLASDDAFVELVRRSNTRDCDLRAEGKAEGKVEVAIQLLKGGKLSNEEVAKACNLELSYIIELRKELMI